MTRQGQLVDLALTLFEPCRPPHFSSLSDAFFATCMPDLCFAKQKQQISYGRGPNRISWPTELERGLRLVQHLRHIL